MSLERFETLPEYDNKYAISSWGKVYVTQNATFTSRGFGFYGNLMIKRFISHEIKTEPTSKGYLRVPLFKNGKRKWHKVHRLVAKAFIPNPEEKPQVNHIDGNKANNSVTNLEWVTDEENKAHRRELLND